MAWSKTQDGPDSPFQKFEIKYIKATNKRELKLKRCHDQWNGQAQVIRKREMNR